MTAKEMFLNLENVKEYRESKYWIEIYEKEKDEPYIIFDKNTELIIFNAHLFDEEQKIYNSCIELEELKAINKQVEELGWNNE